MLIRNVRLSTPQLFGSNHFSNNTEQLSSVLVNENGQLEFSPPNAASLSVEQFDAQGALLLPGLMDTHIHGCHDADFADGSLKSLDKITQYLGANGVAFCYATFVSLPLHELRYALQTLDMYLARNRNTLAGRASIVGVHLEGPYLSQACCGAHSPKNLLNNITLADFTDLVNAAPQITEWKITLAPDVSGAIEFIRQVSNGLKVNDRTIQVSVYLGHSNAAPSLIEEALAAGAVGFTHLGNANAETMHRSQSALTKETLTSAWVKTALNHGDKTAEIIADGNHVSAEFIKLVRTHFNQNVLLISDALRPAGMPNGEYALGALSVIKQDAMIVLKDHKMKLAGSAMLLAQMLPFYSQILQSLQLGGTRLEQAWIDTLYHAPRRHYQGSPLNDLRQFILLDPCTGDILLHMTNGQLFKAEKKSLTPSIKLFDQSKLTSPRDLIGPQLPQAH